MASRRYTLQIHAGPDAFSQVCGAQARKGKALKGWANLVAALMGGSYRGGQVDVGVDDGTGGTPASQTITYTAPAGAQTITIAGRLVSGFSAGADATATAMAAVAAIQADAVASRLVSASNVAGVVTLKAKTFPCSHTLANGATLAVTGTGAAVGGATFTGGVVSTDAGYAL